MNTAIVGWGHIPFGRREEDVESMLLEVTGEALKSAGVGASDVDAVYLGWFNGGMNEQDFGSSLVMNGFLFRHEKWYPKGERKSLYRTAMKPESNSCKQARMYD